jgi:tetratricopeptide (TPR) repeat protein
MTYLKNLFALLLLLGLIGCDEQAAKPATELQRSFESQAVQTFPGIEQLESQLAMNPNDFATLSALGDMYFEAGQYFEAIQTYDKAAGVNPMCADCFNDKGLALYYLGDADAALASFDKAVAIDPGYIHAWLSKGFVLVSTGRYQEAIEPLNKVKELDTTGGLAAEADKFLAVVAERTTQ